MRMLMESVIPYISALDEHRMHQALCPWTFKTKAKQEVRSFVCNFKYLLLESTVSKIPPSAFLWGHTAEGSSSYTWAFLALCPVSGSLLPPKEIAAFKLISTLMGRLAPSQTTLLLDSDSWRALWGACPAPIVSVICKRKNGWLFCSHLNGWHPSGTWGPSLQDILNPFWNTLNSIIIVVNAVPPLLPLPETVAGELRLQYHPAEHQGLPTLCPPRCHFQTLLFRTRGIRPWGTIWGLTLLPLLLSWLWTSIICDGFLSVCIFLTCVARHCSGNAVK